MFNLWTSIRLVLLLIGSTHQTNSISTGQHKTIDGTASHRTKLDDNIQSNVAGFEKIEEYLQEHVDNEDTQPNMDAVKDLLIEQVYKPMDQQLSAALEMFVNLDKLTRDSSCNHYGYDFLVKLKAATNYRIDRRTTKRHRFFLPLRRIELLMSRFALTHARRCRIVYQYRFARLLSEYDRSKLHSMDAFIGLLINDRFEQGLKAGAHISKKKAKFWRIYANLIDKNDSFKRTRDAKLALNLMMSRSDDQFTNLPENELKDRVKAWFKSHLMEPCEDYLNTMARDVFIPAELDTRVMDKEDKIKPTSDGSHNRFIDGWVRYGTCRILERDRHILIKNVVSLLKKQQD